jgi:membrane protein implicated in regulation of membrane protease activity
MPYLFLIAFIAGLLLAVRLMFFGAERRRLRSTDATPLRRSEPAIVGFLMMFGVAGYLLTRHGTLSTGAGVGVALLLALAWAAIVTRIAIIMARIQPEHDPDDPRYRLQGQVGVVTSSIVDGEEGGEIAYDDGQGRTAVRARAIDDSPIEVGEEVCIERIEDGIAFVERWSLVEQRL